MWFSPLAKYEMTYTSHREASSHDVTASMYRAIESHLSGVKTGKADIVKSIITAKIWTTQSLYLWDITHTLTHPDCYPAPERPTKVFISDLSRNMYYDSSAFEELVLQERPTDTITRHFTEKKSNRTKNKTEDSENKPSRTDIAPVQRYLKQFLGNSSFADHYDGYISIQTTVQKNMESICAGTTAMPVDEPLISRLITRTGISWTAFRSKGIQNIFASYFLASTYETILVLSHRKDLLSATYAGNLRIELQQAIEPFCDQDSTTKQSLWTWPDQLPSTLCKKLPPAPQEAWKALTAAQFYAQGLIAMKDIIKSIHSSFLSRVLPTGTNLLHERTAGTISSEVAFALDVLIRV
jgi:hypothetical protein